LQESQGITLNKVKHLAFGNHFLNWFNIATCFQSNKWLPFDWLLISSSGWFPILLLSYFKLLNIHSLSFHISWIHIDMCWGVKTFVIGFACAIFNVLLDNEHSSSLANMHIDGVHTIFLRMQVFHLLGLALL